MVSTRKTLIVGLRGDNLNIVAPLQEHFDMVPTGTAVQQYPPFPSKIGSHSFRYPEILASYWENAIQYIDTVMEWGDDLAGVLVWNSVQWPYRALCLAARARGLPAFEIDHGCLATYMHGHFETMPAADHIFCSPEHAAFLRAYGYEGNLYETGRPQYDTWKDTPQFSARAALKIPFEGPLVLKTTTWTHNLSAWSDPAYEARAEGAIVAAMRIVQLVQPTAFMLSLRTDSEEQQKMRGDLLAQNGIHDVIVARADEANLEQLLPCADVVLCPKGSAAAEAVIAGRPAIIVDFRPQLDEWAWRGKGIIACRTDDPAKIAEQILACMHDSETITRLEAERMEGKLWFNGRGNASQEIARIMREVVYGKDSGLRVVEGGLMT